MSDISKQLSLRPVLAEDLAGLDAAAKADAHCVMYPTHVARVGGEIAGYASALNTPLLNCWLSSKVLNPRASLMLLQMGEALCADKGARTVVVPCAAESPFNPLMEKMGFAKLGATVLYVKKL